MAKLQGEEHAKKQMEDDLNRQLIEAEKQHKEEVEKIRQEAGQEVERLQGVARREADEYYGRKLRFRTS